MNPLKIEEDVELAAGVVCYVIFPAIVIVLLWDWKALKKILTPEMSFLVEGPDLEFVKNYVSTTLGIEIDEETIHVESPMLTLTVRKTFGLVMRSLFDGQIVVVDGRTKTKEQLLSELRIYIDNHWIPYSHYVTVHYIVVASNDNVGIDPDVRVCLEGICNGREYCIQSVVADSEQDTISFPICRLMVAMHFL